jgi:YhcH/YjgK/YiaL family protein
MFMILFPDDAHMPGVAVTRPEPVRKIVVKIAVTALSTGFPATDG